MFTLLYQLRDPRSMIHEPINLAAVELAEQKGLALPRAHRRAARPRTSLTTCRCGVTWIEQGNLEWPAFEPVRVIGSEAGGKG